MTLVNGIIWVSGVEFCNTAPVRCLSVTRCPLCCPPPHPPPHCGLHSDMHRRPSCFLFLREAGGACSAKYHACFAPALMTFSPNFLWQKRNKKQKKRGNHEFSPLVNKVRCFLKLPTLILITTLWSYIYSVY